MKVQNFAPDSDCLTIEHCGVTISIARQEYGDIHIHITETTREGEHTTFYVLGQENAEEDDS